MDIVSFDKENGCGVIYVGKLVRGFKQGCFLIGFLFLNRVTYANCF